MGAPHHQRPPAAYHPVPRDISGHDVELVHRTQAGDREAFAELYALTVDRVTRYVVVRLCDRDRDAVEGVVQDAFCDALADPSLIEPDALGSILRLAARACTRHQWSRRRSTKVDFSRSPESVLANGFVGDQDRIACRTRFSETLPAKGSGGANFSENCACSRLR
jgi:DNA-directed RNA polymerase specialized sigma24 family protein